MNKPVGRGEPPPQGARTNRQRLAPVERPAILQEIDKKAADVYMNMGANQSVSTGLRLTADNAQPS
jgi:hypothetical protein